MFDSNYLRLVVNIEIRRLFSQPKHRSNETQASRGGSGYSPSFNYDCAISFSRRMAVWVIFSPPPGAIRELTVS